MILNELFLVVETLKQEGDIDNITYLRMRSGIEYLINGLETLFYSKPARKLIIDDIAARDIASMAVVDNVDKNDIKVKDGIRKEIDLISKFVDYVINEKNSKMESEEMMKFIQRQYELNEQIEKYYKKG